MNRHTSSKSWKFGVVLALFVLGMCLPAAAQVTIEYMSWYVDAERIHIEEEIIRRFNESQDRIRVEFLNPGTSSANGAFEVLAVLIAGGSAPDVSAIASYEAAQLPNIALDITPYIERDRIDLGALRWHDPRIIQHQGRYYGLPWGYGDRMLAVNLSHFEEAGLSTPQKGWLSEDFIDVARRLTRDLNGDGTPDQFAAQLNNGGDYETWLAIYDAPVVDPDTGEVLVTAPNFVAATEEFVSLWQPLGVRGGNFGNGTASMWPRWEGQIPGLMTASLFENNKLGFVHFHRPSASEPTRTLSQGHVLSVLKSSPHPDEAWEFMKFYMSDEAQQILGRNYLYPSTRAGVIAMVEEGIVPPGYDRRELLGILLDPAEPHIPPHHIPGANDAFQAVRSALAPAYAGDSAVQPLLEGIVGALRASLEAARAAAGRD